MDSERQQQQEFGVWQSPGHTTRVEYSHAVMEELRAMAEEGFQKIPHGGIEVGALLLGQRDDNLVRILEWRPMQCGHARGPGFILSDSDQAALGDLKASVATAPELKDLVVVGWFHTHTRSRIFLSEGDLAIHEKFFPEPWQIALVMRPIKDQPPTAGFFVRDDAGAMKADESPAEFSVNPQPILLTLPRRPSAAPRQSAAAATTPSAAKPEAFARSERPMFRPRERPAAPPPPAPPVPAEPPAPPAAAASVPGFAAEQEPPPLPVFGAKSRMPWGAIALGLAMCVALVAHTYWINRMRNTASLRVEEAERTLLISWDNVAPAVQEADRAVLRIVDGAMVRSVPLPQATVRHGAVTYMRQAEDVEVRLTLFKGGKATVQEFARFVGAPLPPLTKGPATPDQQRLQMQTDVARLREALREESQRAERLREELTVLEKAESAGKK